MRVNFRCEDKLYEELSARSQLENKTITDLMKEAIVEYLYKDTNIQNELLGCIEQINSNVNKANKQFNLFYSMYIYFLNYFFSCNIKEMNQWCTETDRGKDRRSWSKDSKDIYMRQIDEGKATTESFIKSFINNPMARKAMDIHFANVLEEDVNS